MMASASRGADPPSPSRSRAEINAGVQSSLTSDAGGMSSVVFRSSLFLPLAAEAKVHAPPPSSKINKGLKETL